MKLCLMSRGASLILAAGQAFATTLRFPRESAFCVVDSILKPLNTSVSKVFTTLFPATPASAAATALQCPYPFHRRMKQSASVITPQDRTPGACRTGTTSTIYFLAPAAPATLSRRFRPGPQSASPLCWRDAAAAVPARSRACRMARRCISSFRIRSPPSVAV